MCRVKVILKCSLTDALMWVTILQPFKELIWILESLNARTVGGGNIQCFCTESKGPSTYDAMGLTKWNTTCQDRWWWTLFYFLFSLYFTLLFLFLFIFLFLEQLGLGFISHAVTSVTNWWHSHKTDHMTWKNKVEGSGTKWHYTAWTTYAGLMVV